MLARAMIYWAHSDPSGADAAEPGGRWQKLADHLRSVGHVAERLARAARPEDIAFQRAARAAGLLHDFGKYSPEFQRLIRGLQQSRAPHAAHGAAIARGRAKSYETAFAIAGHHSGLPDRQGGAASLLQRIDAVRTVAESLWATAIRDCSEIAECVTGPQPLLECTTGLEGFDLRTRMLFSCVVDADRSDTANHYRQAAPPAAHLDAAARIARLLDYVETRASRVPEGAVKNSRRLVLEACLSAADRQENLFSLTVPTGGGKTLAAMAFALRRAALFPERFRRVVVVIPYLSIIEQNAQVYSKALGADAVLEHHSGDFREETDGDTYEDPRQRAATENWDAPVIVTTSVRFFETLFSNRPAALRRVHNIAGSIVILDEVQTVPRRLLAPILAMLRELAADWNVTFLFCTATQPAFEKQNAADSRDPRWPPGTIREVMPRPAELFHILKRVEVTWPNGPTSWSELAGSMCNDLRALAIVNTRGQALQLYNELRTHRADGKVFHLSTRMCPKHRLDVLARIKEALAAPGQECLVVSTQLVEAGVDVDFPVVYRAMGPFDSIAQAAGRCDREGRLTSAKGRPAGRVIVFQTEDGKLPPGVYREATDITAVLRGAIDKPEDIRRYFHRLYGSADLGSAFETLRREMRFRELSELVKLIESETTSVFVPYDSAARELIEELMATGIATMRMHRMLQRYAIGLYEHELLEARKGAAAEVRKGGGLWFCINGFYDASTGFHPESPTDLVV